MAIARLMTIARDHLSKADTVTLITQRLSLHGG